MLSRCGCCQSEIDKSVVYSRRKCPAINNVVYETKEDALNCIVGDIELVQCPKCNFIFNYSYDRELAVYDSAYRNLRSVSPVYSAYLDKLTDICSSGINEKFRILEIGCGEGEFLKRLCSKTGGHGFGYDNTYDGKEKYGENISFIKDYFQPMDSGDSFDVVVIRHVLEHIPEPYYFLKNIFEKKTLSPSGRVWIEVPDFEWILRKKVFYDITYEHCNYFSKQTLTDLLSSVGFDVIGLKNVFGGQYILLEGIYTSSDTKKNKRSHQISPALNSTNFFDKARYSYNELIENAENICVWGASGKGVIFLSEIADVILNKINYVVDIDPEKQGKFLPVSGKKVISPAMLRGVTGQLLVLIMNGVYEKEIRDLLNKMGVDAQLYVLQ